MNNMAPLYRQIVEDIKSQIQDGKLKAGEQLSSHQALARQYDVSMITIKKALSQLTNEGVIFTRMGKGTYVADKPAFVDFSKHTTLGLVLGDLNSPFFSRIVESIEKEASRNGCNLMLSNSYEDIEKEENQIRHFMNIGISGLIIASMTRAYHASQLIQQLHENDYPYVIVSYMADEQINYVGTDHELGAYLATNHLINLGYKKIGYINSESGNILGELRRKGYLRALEDNSQRTENEFVYRVRIGGGWNYYRSGFEIGKQFAQSSNRPDALFAYNDLIALGFERGVQTGGLKVPNDVAIVGFDNIKRGLVAPVPLTTVHQPTDKIGFHAVKMILDKLESKSAPNRIILKPELVIRASCGSNMHNIFTYDDETKYNFGFSE